MDYNIESCISGKFDNQSSQWNFTQPSHQNISTQKLRILTYNTWFGDYCRQKRVEKTLEILENSNADLIGLQEIIPESLSTILAQKWVQENYYCSDILGLTLDSYGVILLSKFPFSNIRLHDLPSRMNRKLLLADFLINQEDFQVGVVHLESLSFSKDIRGQQVDIAFPILKKAANSLLMGDCNFCSYSEKEKHDIPDSFIDIWPHLQDEEGYTVDTDKNKMRYHTTQKEKQVRYDRIFLHSPHRKWIPSQIELIGTESFSVGDEHVWPSDHFGLLTELQWKEHG